MQSSSLTDRLPAGETPCGEGAYCPATHARPRHVNRDGKIDIIVGNVEAPSTIYFNDGSGRQYRPVPLGDNRGTAYGFAIADLDRDGLPDIAVARSEAPSVVYFADPPSPGR